MPFSVLSGFSILGSLFSASSVASIQIHDDEIKISFLQTQARRVAPPRTSLPLLFPYPSLGLRPIPLCLIYGQIIQIKQRGACAVLTLESEIRLYLLLGISRAPFKRSPSLSPSPLSFRSNNNGSTACQNFDGLQWGAVPGSGRTQHTPLAARCVPAEQRRYIHRYITYIAYIIYSYWLHYQARAAKSLQLNDLNNVLAVLRFTPVWVRQGL